MNVTGVVLGQFATNCYIVNKENERECVLIDPADNASYLISYLKENNFLPKAVLLTHGHYDHILAVPALQEQWPDLKVYCHPLDISKEDFEVDMGLRFPTVKTFKNVIRIQDKDVIKVAGLDFEVIHTPGHTPGSVVFKTQDALFTGDTLFRASIGRTDFAGGDVSKMIESLRKLKNLPVEDINVYPGHEYISTLAWERRYNPYLQRL